MKSDLCHFQYTGEIAEIQKHQAAVRPLQINCTHLRGLARKEPQQIEVMDKHVEKPSIVLGHSLGQPVGCLGPQFKTDGTCLFGHRETRSADEELTTEAKGAHEDDATEFAGRDKLINEPLCSLHAGIVTLHEANRIFAAGIRSGVHQAL